MSSNSGREESCFVLYVDHQDHPAPLSLCYHATGARRLSSTVDRYPPSTLTEVDNAYCPQCLNYHDAVTACSRMGGFCNKASCQKCPLCQCICGVAVVTDNKTLLVYRCGNCSWDSRACGLQEVVSPDDVEDSTGTLSRVEMARALEDLGLQLRNRRLAQEDALQSQWRQLEAAWLERTRLEKSSSSSSSRATTTKTTTSSKRSSARNHSIRKSSPALEDEWSVEALETSLEEKKKNLFITEQSMESIAGLSIHRPSLNDAIPVTKRHNDDDNEKKNRISSKSMQLQIINSASLPVLDKDDKDSDSSNNKLLVDLLPLPIALRVRTSRRCRAELKEGRPGILLKPKLNPLEGDTSMRSQHGQWWKKDSSAIHVMPRVRCVQQYERSTNRRVLLLKVTNPTLSLVRLRFAASSYVGEMDWENDTSTTSVAGKKRTALLHDLLVDERSQKHVNVKLETEILKNLATSESVELLSVEDSFIELGGKSRDIPQVVQDWKPGQEGSSGVCATPPSSSAIRLVACSSSTAWFELTICCLQQQADSDEQTKLAGRMSAAAVPAVPLALQIQLGAGLWDSSLIQPLSTADAPETEDWLTFDLVIVLA